MKNDFVNPYKRSDASKNYVKIIDAAKKVFAVKGLETTIEDVAIEANVGVGSVYRRFSNKQQLVFAVSYEVLQEVFEEQERILHERFSADQMLIEIFACYARLSVIYGKIHEMILDILVSPDPIYEEFQCNIVSTADRIYDEIIRIGKESGRFVDEDPRLIKIILKNTISPQVVKQLAEITPIEHIAQKLAVLALHGIAKRS
ncbi:AcrR family transcriptional regulator [Paenibacillus phyllosphaerae]|uniref:AcrR family transcriptional regulator n=1 Tax=Paenibacillus phyllosphaerae TaxID=274593 RepID=A0A7W5FNP0_9BACL|nr:TetR/AcrR family transcriptional regulator [Paenibacillus phyllosphaerae]MBB3111551.1 AcrR family transcriptional regulator [Paenibacillus phyllosphaerae]